MTNILNLIYHLDEEIWCKISVSGIVTNYSVSTYGNIRNDISNHILVPIKSRKKYLTVKISIKNKMKKFSIHRLVAIAYIKNPKNKPTVNHIDGYKWHNHISNLEWATHIEQANHALTLGLKIPLKGIENPNNIFPEKIIHKICNLLEQGYSNSIIVKEIQNTEYSYNAVRSLIKSIKYKKSWLDISLKYNIPKPIKQNRIYDNTMISRIYELLQQGVSPKNICSTLNVIYTEKIRGLIKNIKIGRYHNYCDNLIDLKGFKKLYPSDLIKNICILLEKGYDSKLICITLKLKHTKKYMQLIRDIKRFKSYRSISKNYSW